MMELDAWRCKVNQQAKKKVSQHQDDVKSSRTKASKEAHHTPTHTWRSRPPGPHIASGGCSSQAPSNSYVTKTPYHNKAHLAQQSLGSAQRLWRVLSIAHLNARQRERGGMALQRQGQTGGRMGCAAAEAGVMALQG